jgi:autotransporter-associated beta strand protein
MKKIFTLKLVKERKYLSLIIVLFLFIYNISVIGQRQAENIGRGLIAINQSSGKVYLSWRLLATDPENIAFNVYRSENNQQAVKLNASPIILTTDYVDNTVNTSFSNTYYVIPVLNGIEQNSSASYVLPANAPVQQYKRISVKDINGKYDYDMKFCWVGDLNGDGEYDFVVDRLPWGQYPDSTGGRTAKVDAYTSDGNFLWRVDAGPNVPISTGHNDMVTVFDLDGDGYAEVIMKTSEGTVFGDGKSISDVNNDGKTDYRDINGNIVGHAPQYISVIDGRTGKELARAYMPHQNDPSPTPGKTHGVLGPFLGHFGVAYMDGIHPSFLFAYTNRNDGGPYDKGFNQFITTWDYKNGQLIQRTDFNDECGANPGKCYSHFHQISIVDVDQDGKDEMVEGGYVLDDNGYPLWGNCEIGHGDRHQTTDIDPDYPGLETFLIQQNNPSSLGMALIEAATGKFIKKWYQGSMGDVGRGEALDINPGQIGVELFSTMPGMYNAKGEYLGEHSIFPNSGIWWDGDLLREMLSAPDGNGFNIMVVKPAWDGSKYTPGTRLIEFAKESGWFVSASYGCRPMFEGDILGDWREEVILKERNSDNTGNIAFRIYTTTIPAQNRLYCLMQNPAYRQTVTAKGYYQAPYTDYYLGYGMAKPPIAPVQKANLTWKGGNSNNLWDINNTQNWQSNNIPMVFNQNDYIMFDISGIKNNNININNIVIPDSVLVISPADYIFNGTGSISGTKGLLKSGKGALIFNNKNLYSGITKISEGAFYVNDTLVNSPVWINWNSIVGGVGMFNENVNLEKGAVIVPAYDSLPGTLTFNKNLTLPGNVIVKFDLSDDTSGINKINDKIIINGDFILQNTNTIKINLLNDSLIAGKYNLIYYSGIFSGDINNLKISGVYGKKYRLENEKGIISLIIEDNRKPATVKWSGKGNTWDLLTTANWTLNGEDEIFAPNDTVIFDSTGINQTKITIAAGSMPIGLMYVETSEGDYNFSGSGAISGTGDIIKNGKGYLGLFTKNTYTGKTIINSGELEINYLDDAGMSSSIGATTNTDPSYFVLNNAKLKYAGSSNIYTNRGLTINGTSDTLAITTSGKMITLKGTITGTASLVKDGAGTVVLQQSTNNYKGNTIIKAGTITLGDETANTSGLGQGNIIFEGGTLSMFSNTSTYTTFNKNLIVESGRSGTFLTDARCDLYGTLTGGGILNYYVTYVRTTIYGNWSNFTGKINVTSDGSGDFRFNNANGLPKAAVYFDNGVSAYRNGGGTFEIGEVSGVATSYMTAGDWVVGGLNTDATYNGLISGNKVTKIGTGSWTLTNANTYSGGTIVNGGTLFVKNTTGSATGTGDLIVNSSATLAGTGIISGSVFVNNNASLAPGINGIGTIKFQSDLSLDSNSITLIDVNTISKTNDLIDIGGKANLNGILKINLVNGSFTEGNEFKIFNAASFTGNFKQIIPAIPAEGLRWDIRDLNTSGIIRVVAPAQTIIFDVPIGKKYGDEPFNLTVKGGASGNPVVLTIISGDAVAISGTTVTVLKAGTVEIKASQAGNDEFLPAQDVIKTLVIDKADQKIIVTPVPNKNYGDSEFNLFVTGGNSGKPILFENLSSDIIKIDSNHVKIIGAGDAIIVATQEGNENYYSAVPETLSFKINKAILSVKVADTSRMQGENNPQFRLIFEGFVYNDNISDIDTLPGVFCEAVDSSAPGIYNIYLAGGYDNNYLFSYINGLLNVMPRNYITNSSKDYILIYPNPLKEIFFIESFNTCSPLQLVIQDIKGVNIYSTQIPANTKTQHNLSWLNPGIYFIKLFNENEIFIYKIVKN